jgi:subtilisin family serine protease
MAFSKLVVTIVFCLQTSFSAVHAHDWWFNNSPNMKYPLQVHTDVAIEIDKATVSYKPKKEIVIAVIDTGIDFSLSELQKWLWINQDEDVGIVGVDDDHNGLVDDRNGYDFFQHKAIPQDDNGHGTQVINLIASILGKFQRNLVEDPAHWIKVMPLKIMGRAGIFNPEAAAKAITYAVEKGAQILSCSWNTYSDYPVVKKALLMAKSKGVIVVNSAGNEGLSYHQERLFPATYKLENMVVVAGMRPEGVFEFTSSFGPDYVHLAAPGVSIKTRTLAGKDIVVEGTSFAAPMVSAALAVVWSQVPLLSWFELKERLMQTVRPLSHFKPFILTSGVLNLSNFISSISTELDEENAQNWISKKINIMIPPGYAENLSLTWIVDKENEENFFSKKSRAVFVFSYFELSARDVLEVRSIQDELLFKWEGKLPTNFQTPKFSLPLKLVFKSDENLSSKGFLISKMYISNH